MPQGSINQKGECRNCDRGDRWAALPVPKVKKMDPGLYDFANFKRTDFLLKGIATEELPARNGQTLEIMDIGSLK